MTPTYLIIANPDGKRWQLYHADLLAFSRQRSVEPEVVVLPWSDVIAQQGRLDAFAACDRPALVRIESPGRDPAVTRQLTQAGTNLEGRSAVLGNEPYRKGQFLHPKLLYRGLRSILETLRRSFDARPHLRLSACPLAIAELFDKRATSLRLESAGIPCPPSIATPATPAALLDAVRQAGYRSAYVKLNTGSSAAGIAVVHPEPTPWAITSLIRLQNAYFCTRRLKRIAGQELEDTLDALLREDAVVQQGIEMAQVDGQNFDVRVVVQHGVPTFTIFRLSNQPMTNLHLGGRRGDAKACRAAIPTRAWLDALDHCVEAAGLYACSSVGVDLLFERGFFRHYLLEINAFGDFFPGLTNGRGQSVHAVDIELTARQQGWIE